MVDMALAMNMCERRGDDLFFIGENPPKLVGTIEKYEINNGVLNIHVKSKQSIKFLSVSIILTEDGVEVI